MSLACLKLFSKYLLTEKYHSILQSLREILVGSYCTNGVGFMLTFGKHSVTVLLPGAAETAEATSTLLNQSRVPQV